MGERTEVLLRLNDAYKFERAKACHKPLADLLVTRLPDLPAETIVVPIPTIPSHIRQRGYDHTLLIARRVAKGLNLTLDPVLERKTNALQRGASRRERIAQAKQAFKLASPCLPDRPYLLVDDVVTTSSTLKYAAQLLRDSGASEVWVGVIARQTSTK